jgi:hypothetical protein
MRGILIVQAVRIQHSVRIASPTRRAPGKTVFFLAPEEPNVYRSGDVLFPKLRRSEMWQMSLLRSLGNIFGLNL